MTAAVAVSRGELLRILGLGFGLAVVVGGAVGQGILRAPGIVAGAIATPGLILAFWALGGLLAAIDAFAIVELGTSVPKSGGPYALAARAFGPFAGTMVGWTDWINGIVGVGFIAVVFAELVQRLGLLTAAPVGALAVGLIAILTGLNWGGTRVSGASQVVGSALKGAALLFLVLALFLFGHGPPAEPAAAGLSSTLTLGAVVVALRAITTTYQGWNTSIYFCEEIHAPERTIMHATFGGVLAITALYLLVNAAVLHVLTPAQIAQSKLPAADAAATVFGDASGLIVTLLALLSVAAIANLAVMYLTRIGHAMARDGVLPAAVGLVAAKGTPTVALALTGLGSAALASTGGYERLIAIGTPITIVIHGVVDAAAIAMRYREPDLHRPYRMPLFPLPAVVGLVINLLLLAALFVDDPLNSSTGLGLVALVGVVYGLRALLTRKPAPAG